MRTATAVLALLLTLAMTTPGAADWQPEDPSKWVQFPDLEPNMGLDVSTTAPYLLADDFPCEMPGYITNIHIWGSWYNDILPFGTMPEAVGFVLSIHADIPADESPTGYSMPGEALAIWLIDAFTFEVLPWQEGVPEGWLEPPNFWEPETDFTCWQYNFELPVGEAFFQAGTPAEPIVYWLDVQATPMDPTALFGWKTSIDHWNDDGVWSMGPEPIDPLDWWELRYPPGHPLFPESIDLAFQLWGQECDPALDSDSDTFNDYIECYLPTDRNDDCTNNPGVHDAWPLDNDMTRDISVTGDVFNYVGRIGATPGSPNWWKRLDIDMSSDISVTGDVFQYVGKVGLTCT
jgi:hypothetical protein